MQPGLLVGVPGMLSGLHQAHQLYGRCGRIFQKCHFEHLVVSTVETSEMSQNDKDMAPPGVAEEPNRFSIIHSTHQLIYGSNQISTTVIVQ